MLPLEYENWAKSAAGHFRDTYGLAGNFALDAARLFVTLWGYGLDPRVTSGFRDPARQKALIARWDSGERAGFIGRPASPETSRHCRTGFLGGPAATAIDMPSRDESKAAAIAAALGIGAGYNFLEKDPGHFYSLKA